MTSKAKSDMTHCGYLYPVRSVGLSFSCWSTTRGFPGRDPHNSSWTKCVLLCPQNLNNLRRTLKNLLIPDPERSPFVHSRIVCLYRIRVICTSFIKSSCQSLIKKTFVPGRNLFVLGLKYILMPDPKSFVSANSSKDSIIRAFLIAKLYLLIYFVKSNHGTNPRDWLILCIKKLRIWISLREQTMAHFLLITKLLNNTTSN